ncbi:hypothetical protein TSTA_109740 [Talaromyces stipitatus ATCC 10500]|uniref:C2H2-type domain-containing protein n=1 Tax=Talaromyces stipitatus (strain ATCC 10500 / CBS 375.48 / QM 6759 / NRRL 1006) TaxID=441959 RepID=B8MUF5_TALSN|nr:uncharacterized protein TSTA_109740 [Talaromyces stipitatus ATCC 10500]EED11794.1 hypothetical protein TSTA_109740 [Talaromyces stipitatus ATCC 10500]
MELQAPREEHLNEMRSGSTLYKCAYPGCPAGAFQTEYLLSSHANIHSQDRPHFCPVAGCPRGIGGKGFKRKNEMIRHGPVHDSPGYVCPYCTDQQHKYLQRHVRIQHVDKGKDDPLLRELDEYVNCKNMQRAMRLFKVTLLRIFDEVSLAILAYYESYDSLSEGSEPQACFKELDPAIAFALEGLKKDMKYHIFMNESEIYYTALILDPRFKGTLI